MYRQCNASMHSEQNQPFLCIGCIASIYFLKILAHSAATVQCITYRWIRGYLGYQRHKWGFQCYQQRCSRWFLAWYQWYRILHIMFNEKKRSQGALWMVTLFIILLLLLFCNGIFPYLLYFLAPQCAHSIGLKPSIHQTSRCWVAVTELCPPSMYSATAPTDSIHL